VRLRAAGCVFAEEEAGLLAAAAQTAGELTGMVARRVAGFPLEHILGWAEFCGLRIALDPGVFVPRRRTQFLVEQAALLLQGDFRDRPGARHSARQRGLEVPVVIDLCCGSGAVGAALAAFTEGIELHAADVDPVAVQCARRNVEAAGGMVYQGDLFDPLPLSLRGQAELLVINAPYVPTGEIGMMPSEARDHEPLVSLDGGEDGLAVHRRIAVGAAEWLAPGGRLLIETGRRQAEGTCAVLARHGFRTVASSSEELEATVVIGELTA
jgi:release factor glutamine methyltransferase